MSIFFKYFEGKFSDLPADQQNLLKKIISEKKEKVFIARPSWIAWFFSIAMLPVLILPPVSIFLMIKDRELLGLGIIILIMGLIFSILVIIGWMNILNKNRKFIAFLKEAFIEKKYDNITIIPWKEIKNVKIKTQAANLPKLTIESEKVNYTVAAARSMNPLKTSTNFFTYRYHLLFSIVKLSYPASLMEIRKEMKKYI